MQLMWNNGSFSARDIVWHKHVKQVFVFNETGSDMSYTELEHGYQVNSLYSYPKITRSTWLMPNDILFAGSQECKQTDVLHRRHKYSAVCYSLNLSFVEKSKFGMIISLPLKASVILHEA